MIKKYLIIVEGKADIPFIRDCLIFLQKEKRIKDKRDKENKEQKVDVIIEFEENQVEILKSKGYTAVQNLKAKLSKKIKDGYRIVLIQDADDSVKHQEYNGGFKERLKYFNKVKKDIKIPFDIFLFPNHKDDGDLETLLLRITNQKKYSPHIKNYIEYCDKVKNYTKMDKWTNELLENKLKVFSYFQVYQGMKNAKEENREYINNDLWNFNHEFLKPLLEFLEKVILKSK